MDEQEARIALKSVWQDTDLSVHLKKLQEGVVLTMLSLNLLGLLYLVFLPYPVEWLNMVTLNHAVALNQALDLSSSTNGRRRIQCIYINAIFKISILGRYLL